MSARFTRRLLRFSLKALFIVVAVVGALLGPNLYVVYERE